MILLRALAEQLPRVQATESLRRAAEVALGSGTLKRQDASALRAQWLRAARAGEPVARVRTAADLERATAAIGIAFEKVKVDG